MKIEIEKAMETNKKKKKKHVKTKNKKKNIENESTNGNCVLFQFLIHRESLLVGVTTRKQNM